MDSNKKKKKKLSYRVNEKIRTDIRTGGRTDGQPGNIHVMPPAPSVRRHKNTHKGNSTQENVILLSVLTDLQR